MFQLPYISALISLLISDNIFFSCATNSHSHTTGVGVVLFQLRTFLDDLDGHVARAKRHIRGERSEIGTTGYYVDGICDGLGCIALMIGIFIFLKNNVS